MMNNPEISKAFEKLVKKKFNLYNSLFLNLPYPNVSNIGMLIPILQYVGQKGLESGKDPAEILDAFFNMHTSIKSEREKIDFMFRIIQYIERQVVLYDSVEDAAFRELLPFENEFTIKDYIHLLENRKEGDERLKKLSTFSTRIVFTAHPTQFYPPAVLDIIAKLKTYITNNAINDIDITLQQLGLTSLINAKKPTPFEEAKNVIYFLRNVYYDAVVELYADIKKNVRHIHFDNPSIIQFGFWPGGDRDGNPFVTAEITNAVADELRLTLMKCYYQDIKSLQRKLTFREIEDVISQLRDRIYACMFDRNKILQFEEIIHPLYNIKEILIANYNSLYLDDLENLINKVKIFKTHFATLDIRQNHDIHKQIVEKILIKENLVKSSLEELDESELIAILLHQEIRVEANQFEDELVKDTILNIGQMKLIQHKNGEAGCNRYIISHAEDIYSVLFVFGLLRWCGRQTGEIPVDIVPLFESMEGMANAEQIMQTLFDIPEYRQHVKQRKNFQTIMLGFSDGTKDGGYLKANWSIFKTKEVLSALCNEYNINVIFFDGRGGPPARGGGKTHRFYASQSKAIANHAIQLTIQGQTISSKYGSREHFINNCEQLITAGLAHDLFGPENTLTNESRILMEKLAELSFEKYQALKNHPSFIPYLEKKSTLRYYGQTNIGSRPAKRGKSKKLELDDLRAIPFVGSWSQLKQNIPGYFGVGTALQSLVNNGRLDELKKLFREVPFFKALILNSMMSLSKCSFELTGYMAEDEEFKEFWHILHKEYLLSKEMTLMISNYGILMEEEPISRKSIEIREKIVLPLLIIQQYALQKTEQKTRFKDSYDKIVERSLYGNVNASRNSA